MTDISKAIDQLVDAALSPDSQMREEVIKQVALELTDRSKGGDSLVAFYSLVGALERLGKLYHQAAAASARKHAAE